MGNVINTFGDETKPFIAADNKTLYFSTDGHKGFGDVDIFTSKRLDDSWTNWSTPKNMGTKVNSPGFDVGYFLDAKGETAYLSSRGDIYKIENAEKPEPITFVSGIVYNKKTNQPMQANIKYYDIEANIELGVATSDPITGAYKIILPPGKKYSFVAQQKEFYPISENIDLKAVSAYNEFAKNLYLLPIEKGEAIRLNNIFFEFNSADLMPESFNEIDRLFDILNENPKLNIEIGGHTDDQGSDQYNNNLSENRALFSERLLLYWSLPWSSVCPPISIFNFGFSFRISNNLSISLKDSGIKSALLNSKKMLFNLIASPFSIGNKYKFFANSL